MKRGRKHDTEFDPNRDPYTNPVPRFTYIELPVHGRIMVNSDTGVVTPMPDSGEKPYPGIPVRLPKKLMDVDQPFIRTCGVPSDTNRGCLSAIGGKCEILNRYGRVGPVNLIIEKYGRVDSLPCHAYYTGVSKFGRPTTSTSYQQLGYRVLTDRTTIPQNILDPVALENGKKKNTVVEVEVADLAPFYPKPKKPKKVEAQV